MTLAQRLTRRVTVECAGRAWPIIFTHGVLLDIEAASGLDILSGSLNPARPSARTLRTVLTCLLRAAGCDCDEMQGGSLLTPRRMPAIRAALLEAWRAAMPDKGDAKKGDAKGGKLISWLDAWAIADQDLGLTHDEWLSITPRMAQALSRRRTELTRQREWMFATVAANVVNFGFAAPEQPIPTEKWMLHPWHSEDDPPEEVTGETIMAALAPLRGKGLIKQSK